jgi:hypothetical protein
MNTDDSLTSDIIDLLDSSSPNSNKLKLFDSSSDNSVSAPVAESVSAPVAESVHEKEIQKCTDTLGIKFKRFCEVIYATMNDTDIESKYSNTIHQMYANTLVNEEIINAVNKKVCMLKFITLIIRPSINSYGFYTIKYDKTQNQSIYNELKADDIVKLTLGCLTTNNDVLNIGIPLAYNYELNQGHQTMLIINVNKIKNKITVEHFDSHGYLSNSDIPQYINIFIKLLFNATINLNKIYFKQSILTNFVFSVDTMDYEYKSPSNICGNTLIQDLTFRSRKWAGSCALFSLWYGFARLVNPEETPNETFKRMHSIMINAQNPYRAIKNIAKSLFDTLEIIEGSPNNSKPNYRGNSIIKTKKGDVKFIKISPERYNGQDFSTPESEPEPEPKPKSESESEPEPKIKIFKKRKRNTKKDVLPLTKKYKKTKQKKYKITNRKLLMRIKKLNNKSNKNKSV